TNRTAIQCFSRYQSHVNKNFVKSFWTPEEDDHLINIVNLLRIDNYIPWSKVCFYMDGRKRHQIINRYERSISREVNRSPWTTQEDAMLIACIKKFGYHWSKMREFFPQRSLHSMRERYFNNLDPELKIGDWSKEEDQKLIRLVKEIGYGKWSKIANEMPGRTDNMCLMRTSLLIHHSKGLQFHSSEDEDDDDDPDKILKIIKPVAPTKNCVFKNNKLKTIQNNAMNTLLNAMKKLLPELSNGFNLEKFDFPSLSLYLLRGIYKELFSNGHKKENICWESETQRRRRKVKKECPESDDEVSKSRFKNPEDNGEQGSDSEEIDNLIKQCQKEEEEGKLDPAKHRWLRKLLEQKFREAASVSLSFTRKKNLAMNGRETAECSLYRSFLYKNYRCLRPSKSDLDIENVTFNGIDYSVTLADVVYHFVQSPISEIETMILSPNVMTLNAMEVLEATKPRMENMSKFVDHSLPYIQYVTGDDDNCSKCLFCHSIEKKESQELQQERFKAVLKSMKENYIVVDGDLENDVACETASEDATSKCICDELVKSKEAVTLFIKRFFSLFLWPTLLSGAEMSQQQENLICTGERSKYFCGTTSRYSMR
ncbi:uncharacterized protein LOC118202305, partial [Stegodyphus dumicola]|uniref:uncharacterized protein LOC118202305 n=1 Tax=Stegodyphus dumicola TaxID=202533 RepID=UPI0015AAE4E3